MRVLPCGEGEAADVDAEPEGFPPGEPPGALKDAEIRVRDLALFHVRPLPHSSLKEHRMTERPTAAGAMSRADSAHQKIDSHEELCAERYRNIHEAIGDLKGVVKGQGKVQWSILIGVAGFLGVTLVAVVLHALRLA